METKESEVYQRWDDGFVIRRMRRGDEPQVMKWFAKIATMSVDLKVALDMRGDDGDGFYVGELNGEMIASLTEAPVADDLRYVSYVYVVERHRRLGFARRMITAAHDIGRRSNWTGIICLDALENKESIYEKFDYKTAFKTTGYKGTVSTDANRKEYGTDIIEVKLYHFLSKIRLSMSQNDL